MSLSLKKFLFLSLAVLVFNSGTAEAQAPQDGTAQQRVNVMSDKLDRMKRGLGSLITALRDENRSDPSKKDDEKNVGTPLGRLVSLQKDVNHVSGDVNNLRGKVDRGDKFDRQDVDTREKSVNGLVTSVDTA